MSVISSASTPVSKLVKLKSAPFNKVLNITLSLSVLALAACQPAENISDEETVSEKEAISDSALSAERTQTIGQLGGVPVQTLATFDPQEIKQGGDTGITITSSESYSKPSSNFTASRKGDFFIGNAFNNF